MIIETTRVPQEAALRLEVAGQANLLDCGGKSDATPLWNCAKAVEMSDALGRAKTPSSLRSAGVVQNAVAPPGALPQWLRLDSMMRMAMGAIFPWALGLVALLLAGCVTEEHSSLKFTGDPLVDGENAIQNGPARDKVLWEYRTALAAMHRGQFDVAKRDLDDAIARISSIYGKDEAARKSRSTFSAESSKTFLGEPYERVMAWYYRGILYWMDGEPDNARACFRSGQLADSDAENKAWASDYVLLDYLDGYVTAKLGGDGSDAMKRAAGVAQQWKPPTFSTNANVLVFVDYGAGPLKFATGRYGEQLRFRPQVSHARNAVVKVGPSTGKAVPYDDLVFQATTRGGRVMDHVLASKAVFKSSTDTAGDVAIVTGAVLASNKGTQTAGLATMGAGLISKIFSSAANPEADTRTWNNLPQSLSFVAFELSPGPHFLTVDFLDEGGRVLGGLSRTVNFEVPAGGRDKVIYVSDKSSTPQSQ